ncbi:hypothetical protein Trydic_g372 [Trypoxylus dichotomus]
MSVIILCLFVKILIWNGVDAVCDISVKTDISNPSPLLINETAGKPAFALPDAVTGKITVDERASLQIYCPQSTVMVSGSSTSTNLVTITCVKSQFRYGSSNVPVSAFTCAVSPKSVAQYTGIPCLKQYKEFQIGYEYKKDFITLIKGCFDKKDQITLYTASTIPKAINVAKQIQERKCWTVGGFFTIPNVNEIYSKAEQTVSINNQLGLPSTSTKYIASTTNRYLARGHLTPKTDFIFGPQQDATFICINAVPQWQTLNAGNWKKLEADLKDLATARKRDIKITTGMSDILSYPHDKTSQQTPLYMYTDLQQKAIPIPKYIWKIAYIEELKQGIAFVGVNDPYFSNTQSVTVCPDVCSQASYIQLNWSNHTRYGYVYCCEIDALRSKVSNVPIEVPTKLKLLV